MALFVRCGKNSAVEKRVGRTFLSSTSWIIVGLVVFCGAIAALVWVWAGSFNSNTSAAKTSYDDSTTTLFMTMSPTAAQLHSQIVDGDHADHVPDLENLYGYPSVIPTASPPVKMVSGPTPTNTAAAAELSDIENYEFEEAEHRVGDSSSNGVDEVGETIFYAIGDVPYDSQQAVILKEQMLNLASDCEFVIHVGDIRHGGDEKPECRREEYQLASDLLRLSPVPVFIIIGDNDWTGKSSFCWVL